MADYLTIKANHKAMKATTRDEYDYDSSEVDPDKPPLKDVTLNVHNILYICYFYA